MVNPAPSVESGGKLPQEVPASPVSPVGVVDHASPDGLEMYIPEDVPPPTDAKSSSDSPPPAAEPATSIFLADEELSPPPAPPVPEVQVGFASSSGENGGISEMDGLQDVTLEEIVPSDTSMDEITLNKPEQIYYELYRKTKQKAKEVLLEAKRIKEQYQLDVSDLDEESDEEDEEEEDL
jgi:hypothetical protein